MREADARGAGTPGWYQDPVGRHEHRYWDGSAWTQDVADGGQTSVDPIGDAQGEPTSERVAMVVPMATDVQYGGYMNLYLTDRRLVVDKVMGTTIGAHLAGGFLGGAIADAVAQDRSDRALEQGRELNEIVAASRKNYSIDYSTVTQVRLKRKAMPPGHSRCKISSSQKNVTLAFKHEFFDEVTQVMRQVMGDRLAVK